MLTSRICGIIADGGFFLPLPDNRTTYRITHLKVYSMSAGPANTKSTFMPEWIRYVPTHIAFIIALETSESKAPIVNNTQEMKTKRRRQTGGSKEQGEIEKRESERD